MRTKIRLSGSTWPGALNRQTKGQELVALVEIYPGIRSDQLLELLGVSKSGLYRFLSELKEKGVLIHEGKGGGWRKSQLGKQV